MFGKRKASQELELPPIAHSNPAAVEVLRVWAAPGEHQQVSLRPTWEDPAAWGILLVDLARHLALAYEREGQDRVAVLQRIRQMFDAEWDAPTDRPNDLTDEA